MPPRKKPSTLFFGLGGVSNIYLSFVTLASYHWCVGARKEGCTERKENDKVEYTNFLGGLRPRRPRPSKGTQSTENSQRNQSSTACRLSSSSERTGQAEKRHWTQDTDRQKRKEACSTEASPPKTESRYFFPLIFLFFFSSFLEVVAPTSSSSSSSSAPFSADSEKIARAAKTFEVDIDHAVQKAIAKFLHSLHWCLDWNWKIFAFLFFLKDDSFFLFLFFPPW